MNVKLNLQATVVVISSEARNLLDSATARGCFSDSRDFSLVLEMTVGILLTKKSAIFGNFFATLRKLISAIFTDKKNRNLQTAVVVISSEARNLLDSTTARGCFSDSRDFSLALEMTEFLYFNFLP